MRLTREEATFVIDYSKYLNDRARVIKPSGIRRFFDIANEMEDVISDVYKRQSLCRRSPTPTL